MIARSQREPTPDFCTVDDDTITDAFLGSCTNARYEDIVAGAAIMRGHQVAPRGQPDRHSCQSQGLSARHAGRDCYRCSSRPERMLNRPTVSLLWQSHGAVMSRTSKMISSSNRNYKAAWVPEARIFLASPATVIASAIEGRITDPRKVFVARIERICSGIELSVRCEAFLIPNGWAALCVGPSRRASYVKRLIIALLPWQF